MPYEGCGILVFAGDVSKTGDRFMKGSEKVALRMEEIEGQKVAVFQETLEKDVWTTFVAFPKQNTAIAASNRDYVREVLARMRDIEGERAFPAGLREWKYVDVHAPFWGLRHFHKNPAKEDLSSPFARLGSMTMRDEQAIGLTFDFDPRRGQAARITYLSNDKDILRKLESYFSATKRDPMARDLHVRYRELEPGVVEGSYDLVTYESFVTFTMVLMWMLGHGLFV